MKLINVLVNFFRLTPTFVYIIQVDRMYNQCPHGVSFDELIKILIIAKRLKIEYTEITTLN